MAAAPYGSSLILPISYAYISMMGSEGLTNVREGALPGGWGGAGCLGAAGARVHAAEQPPGERRGGR